MRFLTILLLCSTFAFAGEKKLMHCFAFTTIDSATPEQWTAFQKATDELPSKIKTISRVWHGKLMRPLQQYQAADPDTAKNFGAQRSGTGNFNRLTRSYGVCMEFASEAALKAYVDDPGHKEWSAAYEKVRVAGTTTFDILGQ